MFGMRTLRNCAVHRTLAISVSVSEIWSGQADPHGMLEGVFSELDRLVNHISWVYGGEVLQASILDPIKLLVVENSRYSWSRTSQLGRSLEQLALENSGVLEDTIIRPQVSSTLGQNPLPFGDVTSRSSKKSQPESVSPHEMTPCSDHVEFGDTRGCIST